ncbi:MAG: hypothetical protein NVV74_15920 [Magnetospirillum sp.]|nr:hypothetical protein [Magnetospirillum sp.]
MAAEEFAEGVEPQRRRAQSATNAQTAKEREALLRNRIQSVIAAARKMKNLSHRDIAKILVGTPSGQRFSSETIRKILAGTYPPQKDLGIGGL